MKYDFTVLIHRLYFSEGPKKGGLDLFLDYFETAGKKILLIEMPLDYCQKKVIRITSIDGKKSKTLVEQITLPTRNNIVNWGLEFFICVCTVLKYKTRDSIVISSDPLSTFPAVFLRQLKYFKMHYYHSVDFSSDRFKYKIMNFIYKALLVLGIKMADVVGVVTLQAKDRLKKYNPKKIIFVPNSPDYESIGIYRKPADVRTPLSVVITCAEVDPKFKIIEIVKLIENLRTDLPEIILRILGYLNPESGYCLTVEKYITKKKLGKNIIFYSQVPRETNFEIISRSYVGLAFYDNTISHVKYGDSLKIREYAALGLPCISDKNTLTALEMEENGAGVTVTSMKQACENLKQLLTDPVLYSNTSESALAWAKKMDKRLIMDKISETYFNLK